MNTSESRPWPTSVEPLRPPLPKSKEGGRHWIPNRPVLEGILWILRTGARWQDLPDRYPSPSTCWCPLKLWEEQGVWLENWRAFLGTLDERKQLDWSETFADGSFAPAKKGATASAKLGGGKAQSGSWWSMARVLLRESTCTPAASLAEVDLLEPTLATIAVPRPGPRRPRQKPVR